MIDQRKARFFCYALIWVAYLLFMKSFAPLGINWLPWHEARIFNFVEYLNVNPYWQSYGFSIWNECRDCSSIFTYSSEQIYLSKHSFAFSHFIFLNSVFGKSSLIFYGPIIDKIVIFCSGAVCSELFIKIIKGLDRNHSFFLSIVLFSLFVMSPWTYKMILGAWTEIYFLMFFLFALYAVTVKKYNFALFFLFISGLYNYQWSFLLALFFILIILISFLTQKQHNKYQILDRPEIGLPYIYKIIFSLALPVFIFICLRLSASSISGTGSGSDLLYRIGISGNDIHNGGILGSLQFLAGNRVSECIEGLSFSISTGDLNTNILVFNCLLSLAGMFLISGVAIGGFILLLKRLNSSHIFLPLAFAFLSTILLLQQSSSVHLMGYSYIFSVFFSIGLTAIFYFLLQNSHNNALKIIFTSPVFIGIILLCIHVSMLTGSNG